MGAKLDPAKAAAKWADRLSQSTQAYTDGINGFSGNPMALAASKQSKFLQSVTDSVNSGRYANSLNNTPVSKWKSNAAGKGAQRLSSGATAAKGTVQNTFTKLFSDIANIQSHLQTMPTDSYEQRMQRARFVSDQLHSKKGSYKS